MDSYEAVGKAMQEMAQENIDLRERNAGLEKRFKGLYEIIDSQEQTHDVLIGRVNELVECLQASKDGLGCKNQWNQMRDVILRKNKDTKND